MTIRAPGRHVIRDGDKPGQPVRSLFGERVFAYLFAIVGIMAHAR